VGVYRERKPGALTDALYQAIDGIRTIGLAACSALAALPPIHVTGAYTRLHDIEHLLRNDRWNW
jgi:hypothetical protein